jgi:pilus assembly protein Flp/PilA
MIDLLKRLLREEDGPTAVEYAVMLALIVAVCVGAVKSMANATAASFDASAAELDIVM